MHQGRAMPHAGHFPIAFMYPTAGQLHNLSTVVGDDRVGWLSIPIFVEEVTGGAERWLAQFGQSKTVARNLEKFALAARGAASARCWPGHCLIPAGTTGFSERLANTGRMAQLQYRVVLLKAWTKDTLATKIERTLDPYAPDEIVSIEARVDFQFFVPWRRDWALIVVKRLDEVT
jgi:hypothetical protein